MFQSENSMIVDDALQRIDSVLNLEPLKESAHPQIPADTSVELSHIHFSYDGENEVLKDISIARAFLKNAPIILLDEATASLDVENETLIQTALSRLIREKTVLVIAHRMRTVAGADKIVVLDSGVVSEQGTPEELLKKDGAYAHMIKLQTESQNWTLA